MTVKSQTKGTPGLLLQNRHYSGTAATLLYNWPIFVGLLLFGMITLTSTVFVTTPWSTVLTVLGVGSFAVIVSILLNTYFVYDWGKTHEYDRLAELGQVDQANVVLDITCGKLRGTRGFLPHFQKGHYFLIDVYNAEKMPDQALSRARDIEPPLDAGRRIYQRPGKAEKLPVPHQWADVIFCDYSLHEIQDRADREAIFAEFSRVLKSDGRLVIAEHRRDWRNFLAFGPGILSFFPTTTWENHIDQAGLQVKHRESWRGLVDLWVVGK